MPLISARYLAEQLDLEVPEVVSPAEILLALGWQAACCRLPAGETLELEAAVHLQDGAQLEFFPMTPPQSQHSLPLRRFWLEEWRK